MAAVATVVPSDVHVFDEVCPLVVDAPSFTGPTHTLLVIFPVVLGAVTLMVITGAVAPAANTAV